MATTPTRNTPRRRSAAVYVRRFALGLAVVLIFGIAAVSVLTRSAPKSALPIPDRATTPDNGGSGKDLFIQILDKQDATRKAGELRAASMEPIGTGRYRVVRPRAWYFLSSGESVHIEADGGDITKSPERKTPEKGTLSGGVVVRFFGPTPDGRQPELGTDTPAAVFRTESLTFDTLLGELFTEDVVHGQSTWAEFEGLGLRVFFNEPQQRINSLTILEGRWLVLKQSREQQKTTTSTSAGPEPSLAADPAGHAAHTPGAPTTASTDAPSPRPVSETLYQITFTGDVSLCHQTQSLSSENLDLWIRLFNNALPEGAIASLPWFEQPPAGEAAEPRSPVAASPGSPPTAGDRNEETPASAGDESGSGSTVLVWSGPMTIVPLGSAPEELAEDHVFARAASPGSGRVSLEDAASGASALCAALDYGATSRTLALHPGAPAWSVTISAPGSGSLVAGRLHAHASDLGQARVDIEGPAIAVADAIGRELRWSGPGRLDLDLSTGRPALERADFAGAIRLTDGRASVTGDHLAVGFARTISGPGDDPRGLPATPRHMTVTGNVLARDADSGSLAADRLDVDFDPAQAADRELAPTLIVAEGDVIGRQHGAEITGRRLEANLARLPKGDTSEVAVTTAVITGDATYAEPGRDGQPIFAMADEIRADARAQTAMFLAHAAEPARVTAGTSHMLGWQIQLDSPARSALVWGPGGFAQRAEDSDVALLEATWTTEMYYRDIPGRLDARGDVHAVARTADKTGVDTIDAEELRMFLTLPEDSEPAVAVADETSPIPDIFNLGREDGAPANRELKHGQAWGASHFSEGGEPARIESRRYAKGGTKLVRLAYSEGDQIIADNEAGVFEIPGPGKLLLGDLRAGGENTDEGGSAIENDSGLSRGYSVFDWDGSMSMSTLTGVIEMDERVRLKHLAMTDRTVTTLDAERLVAHTRASGGGDISENQLVRASARGSVHFAAGPPGSPPVREMTADAVEYDAEEAVATATAEKGRSVTVFESAKATTAHASVARWDMRSNRIQLEGAGPVASPR